MSDEALLLHAMLLICGADGPMAEADKALLEAHFLSLPELRGQNFRQLYAEAEQILVAYPTREASAAALAPLTQRWREKALWLVLDIALSRPILAAGSSQMLAAVMRACQVDSDLATKIREVIALKYV